MPRDGRGVMGAFSDFWDYRVPPRIALKAVPSQLDRPIATFTFDDFPRSALTCGGSILEDHGATGTYYAAGSLCDTHHEGVEQYRIGDIADLIARGHELGDHTFGHIHAPHHRAARLELDSLTNRRFLTEAAGGDAADVIATTFAYPFGHASLGAKHFYARRFASCRGTATGINHGRLDLSQLRAVSLEARLGLDIAPLLAEARARNGWIIFYTHEVQEGHGPYGTAPMALAQAVKACRDAGIDILPMRNALARACFGQEATRFPIAGRP